MTEADKEQIQLVKDWWKRYGSTIVVAVLVFLLSNYGWRYWHKYKDYKMERASVSYTQMMVAMEKKKPEEADLYAKNLLKDYPKSAYASFAAFFLAKNAVVAGNYSLAQEKLSFVIDNASNKSLRQIARIRLARILLQLKKPQEAIDLLKIVDDVGFRPEINEISGDALVTLNKTSEAKKAYQEAADANKTTNSSLLQLKMRKV